MLTGCVPPAPKALEPEASISVAEPAVTIAVVGDTLLGASAEPVLQQQGYPYAFTGSRHLYAGADLVIANLEGPLTKGGTRFDDKTYTFRSSPEKVSSALKSAGINAVTLANNHILDFGAEGLFDTMQALDAKGIGHFGAGQNMAAARSPHIVELQGVRIGLLGYSLTFPEEFWATSEQAGTAFGHREHMVRDVQALKGVADIVLVICHWGRESRTELRPYQEQLAHAVIDAGADAVIGHHPHIAQAVELYRGKPILYSLGNYVFGSYSNRVQYGLVAKLRFVGNKPKQLILTPIDVNNFRVQFKPVPATGSRLDQAVEELQRLSAERGTLLQRDRDELILQLP